MLSNSDSSSTVSSDEPVIEEDRESAGVDVGLRLLFLARASAWDSADR